MKSLQQHIKDKSLKSIEEKLVINKNYKNSPLFSDGEYIYFMKFYFDIDDDEAELCLNKLFIETISNNSTITYTNSYTNHNWYSVRKKATVTDLIENEENQLLYYDLENRNVHILGIFLHGSHRAEFKGFIEQLIVQYNSVAKPMLSFKEIFDLLGIDSDLFFGYKNVMVRLGESQTDLKTLKQYLR